MAKTKERDFYPPNTFNEEPHWNLEIRHVDGSWRIYTQHKSTECATKMMDKVWTSNLTEFRKVSVNVPWNQHSIVPCTIPLGFA